MELLGSGVTGQPELLPAQGIVDKFLASFRAVLLTSYHTSIYHDVIYRGVIVSLKRFLPLSETQFLIMVCLTEPAHGYRIMQRAEQMTTGKTTIGPGTMYGTIKKLLKNRLIEQVDDKARSDRRITYRLTEAGRKLLILEVNRLTMLAEIGSKYVNAQGGKTGE